MGGSSDSSPKTSVPLPGSIDTRAFGATSQRSAARSMRPRRLRVVPPVWSVASIFIASSRASSSGSTFGGGGSVCPRISVERTATPFRSFSAALRASCVRSHVSSCRVSRSLCTVPSPFESSGTLCQTAALTATVRKRTRPGPLCEKHGTTLPMQRLLALGLVLLVPVSGCSGGGDASPFPGEAGTGDAGPEAAGDARRGDGSILGPPCLDDTQCDDGVECTPDSCNHLLRRCQFVAADSRCPNGIYCAGFH